MKKESKTIEEYGVVIFLDALGTKGIWKEKTPSTVISNWEQFVKEVEGYFKDKQRKLKIHFSINAFSDTIIITAVSEHSIEPLLLETAKLIQILFVTGLARDLYFRGTISTGTFYLSEKIIIGPAVDEASHYYAIGDWVGVSTTPSTHSILERMKTDTAYNSEIQKIFTVHDIPTKDGIHKNTWVIKLDPKFKTSKNRSTNQTRTLKDLVHKKLEHLTDIGSASKWKNTLDFLNKHK